MEKDLQTTEGIKNELAQIKLLHTEQIAEVENVTTCQGITA